MGFDFDTPYKKYPRKGEGKTAGMKKVSKEVKSEEDYCNFCRAVENYAELCTKNRTERQYVKMWSTFCNNWQDYIDREELGLASAEVVYFT